MKKQPIFKVVVLGEGTPCSYAAQVGKTSMTLKYVNDVFNEHLPRTINASYLEKEVTLRDSRKVKLAIWVSRSLPQDTAGQEMYNAMAPIYYRDASAAVIVFDITSPDSFDKVRKWIVQLRNSNNENIVITIVGNKLDLQTMRKVQKAKGEGYASEQKVAYFEVSARNGKNISKVFEHVAEEIAKQQADRDEVKINKKPSRRRLEIEEDKDKKPEKKKCC